MTKFVETAIWLDGRETPADYTRFKHDVESTMRESSTIQGHILGPVTWAEKKPGDERVPAVPDHIAGPNVRLLVAEAQIIGLRPVGKQASSFVYDLELDDQARLRRVTRREYERAFPGRARLTDRQCDTLINDIGPEAAVAALQAMKPSDLH